MGTYCFLSRSSSAVSDPLWLFARNSLGDLVCWQQDNPDATMLKPIILKMWATNLTHEFCSPLDRGTIPQFKRQGHTHHAFLFRRRTIVSINAKYSIGLNWFLKLFPFHIVRLSDVIHANPRTGSHWWVCWMTELVSMWGSVMSQCVGPLWQCFDSQLTALWQHMVSHTEGNTSTGAVQKPRWAVSAFNRKPKGTYWRYTCKMSVNITHIHCIKHTCGLDQKISHIWSNINPAFQVNTSMITTLILDQCILNLPSEQFKQVFIERITDWF